MLRHPLSGDEEPWESEEGHEDTVDYGIEEVQGGKRTKTTEGKEEEWRKLGEEKRPNEEKEEKEGRKKPMEDGESGRGEGTRWSGKMIALLMDGQLTPRPPPLGPDQHGLARFNHS